MSNVTERLMKKLKPQWQRFTKMDMCSIKSGSFTFQAADPPQARVGEGPGVLLVLVVGVLLR